VSSYALQVDEPEHVDVQGEGKILHQPPVVRCKGQELETVIIFDWDDTLLCSSALNAKKWGKMELQPLEKAVTALLRIATCLGETIIVTNGNTGWVEESAGRYMPKVVPILSGMQVVSARSKHAPEYPGNPIMWKYLVFQDFLDQKQRDMGPDTSGINLVVLGDSLAEIKAARTAMKVMSSASLLKTVRFKPAPLVDELVGQLRRVALDLDRIVREDRSADRGLVQRRLPVVSDHINNLPSAWRMIGK